MTPVDFKKILRRLSNNPRNQAMVYDVFQKFHRDRFWIANTIDKWLQREKMMLEGEVWIQKQNWKCANFFFTDHGGFSSVAQTVKAQLVKAYMLHMLRNAGWCIATHKGRPNQPKRYIQKSNSLIVKTTISWLQCYQRNHHTNDALYLAIMELQTV